MAAIAYNVRAVRREIGLALLRPRSSARADGLATERRRWPGSPASGADRWSD
ncbi:MAG: hypothetical protein IPP35_12130 [Elusimicrobia bacterium]|nr:hypothetical protein [Elusimicrobiota bacterium]